MFGSVLGIALGGTIAEALGWRWSFAGMALFGLLLALAYPAIVKPSRIEAPEGASIAPSRDHLRTLVGTPSVIAAYVGCGLQLFIGGAVLAWMPSYLNRYYDMAPGRAGTMAGVFVLACGVGMILCGMLSDRLCRRAPERKVVLAAAYCLASFVLLSLGFRLAPGSAQLAVLFAGMFVCAGTTGPSGAIVANLTHAAVHGSAFAMLTLANNLLGLAPGPFVTGVLADRLGLLGAFQVIPLISLVAAAVFLLRPRPVFERPRLGAGAADRPRSAAERTHESGDLRAPPVPI